MNALLIEQDYCIGCFACEAACAQEQRLSIGDSHIKIKEEEIYKEGKWKLRFVVVVDGECNLCASRLKKKHKTACEQHCISQCITSGEKSLLLDKAQEIERSLIFFHQGTK
jgi:Fe-S-cluster-containing dehydrogenase component